MNGKYNSTFRLRKGIWGDAGEPLLFAPVDVTDCKSMLNGGGGYLVENIYDFDCKEETAAWFVIKDSFGGMDELSSNMRNQVRKSLKTFEVKRITNEYLAENGYEVFRAAQIGYGIKEEQIEKEENWKKGTLNTGLELWGAICRENGRLAAYGENQVNELSCNYRVLKADPAYRKQYAYYGLIYEMNRHYLEERGLKYVNDGFRSLTEHSNIQPFLIEKFKFRKAYCKANIVYKWWVGIAVRMLYPLRKIIRVAKLQALLRVEEIRRGSR